MDCAHRELYSCSPVIWEAGQGGAGINRLLIRQPFECKNCGKMFYRWSYYNEDESTAAMRED